GVAAGHVVRLGVEVAGAEPDATGDSYSLRETLALLGIDALALKGLVEEGRVRPRRERDRLRFSRKEIDLLSATTAPPPVGPAESPVRPQASVEVASAPPADASAREREDVLPPESRVDAAASAPAEPDAAGA